MVVVIVVIYKGRHCGFLVLRNLKNKHFLRTCGTVCVCVCVDMSCETEDAQKEKKNNVIRRK